VLLYRLFAFQRGAEGVSAVIRFDSALGFYAAADNLLAGQFGQRVRGFQRPCLEQCGFLSTLNNPMGEPYNVLWNKAVGLLAVSESIKKELNIFGAQLGKTDFVTQKERAEMCRNILVARKNELEPGLEKRRKSIRALGGLIGAMIAIILL